LAIANGSVAYHVELGVLRRLGLLTKFAMPPDRRVGLDALLSQSAVH
jgi:hypothetical protein